MGTGTHTDLLFPFLASGHLPFFFLTACSTRGPRSSHPALQGAASPHVCRVLVLKQGPSKALVASCSRQHGTLSQWCPLPVGVKAAGFHPKPSMIGACERNGNCGSRSLDRGCVTQPR